MRPDDVVEHAGGVVRCVSATGWSGVTYSDLAGRDADAAIAAQLARMPGTWEWKHYSHDEPPDLPERLLAAGFEAEEPETLMVAELDRLDLPAPAPPGFDVRAVGADGIADLVAVHDAVFGGDHVDVGRVVRRAPRARHRRPCRRLRRRDAGRRLPARARRGHRLRGAVGRLHAALPPRPRALPRDGRAARPARARARLPLPAGRRDGDQPAAVRAPGLRRARDDHAVHLAWISSSLIPAAA